jgi:3-methyladenine DNA glycosylase AlkD
MNLSQIKKEIRLHSATKRASNSKSFFKTGPGEYGEGDCFLGITVPKLRSIAVKAVDLNFKDVEKLLDSKWHEERFIGVVILVYKYQKDLADPKDIYTFYLKNAARINNWDLVDVSADKIIGAYTFHHVKKNDVKKLLNCLSSSSVLWDRRIAVLTCFYYIRKNNFDYIIWLSKKLINDEHDLMHKALGWMLRETGKRNKSVLIKFLDQYADQMPRTMLRYAIEKFPMIERKKYLAMKGKAK